MRAIVLSLMLLGALTAALGQTAVDGVVHGVVVDAGGAAVRGASVQVEDAASGFVARAGSDKGGEFLVARVPVGTYRVVVEAAGFERLVLADVVVEVGAVTGVDARLRVAGVSTTVTVTASGSSTVESTAVASTVTAGEIQRLPVRGRRWQSFALLTPAANADVAGLLSFRGLAVTQNSTAVDGVSDDQSFGSVPRGTGAEGERGVARRGGAAYTFSQEAVREFRVSGQNYSAVYGGAAGGVVTTVSKSGTDTLHGSAFYLARDSAWAAANPFSIATHYADGVVTSGVVKPHDLRQQFGGSVGGAAVRNRLFYFYAFDQQRRDFPAVSSPQNADFYALTLGQMDLLGGRGVSASKVNTALDYLDSLTGMVPRRQNQTVNFGKLDWQATAKNRLSVQYDRARSSAPGGVRSSAVVDRGRASLGSSYVKVDSLLGRWLWSKNAKFSNELRLAVGRDFQYEEASAPLPQEPAVGPGGYAPEVVIGPNGLTFGTPSSLGRKAYPDERRVQFADMVTLVRGHHQVQVGGDLSLVHDYIDSLSGQEGAFHYDSGAAGGGLVDWITDYTFNVNAYPNGECRTIGSQLHYFCFTSFTQSFGQAAVTFDTQEWAGYVQDHWQVRRGLTVDAGLRYEYELLPLPQRPNIALDAEFGLRGASSVFPEDRNNVGPRVGVAWEPLGEGRGVVRVGYGLFYGRLPGATVRSALVNTALPTSATHVRITPTTITDCPQVPNQGFGYACAYLTTPPAAVGTTTSATVFDRGFRLPAVQQGSLTVERKVGVGVVGSASYLLNLDRQLPDSVDINIAPATSVETFQLQGGTGAPGVRDGEMFAVPVYSERVDASYGPVTDLVSDANASYNALVIEARRRSVGGLEFRASWTWSKAIDFGESAGATPRTNGQFDPFDLRYDKGLSALNYPHKLVASAVWEPKASSRRRWLRVAGSGWSVAPLFTERSGRPYSFNIYGGRRLAGGHQSINGSGGAVYLPTVGRNTLRLPDAANLDLRVSRTLRAAEKVRVKGVAEIFNVTNRVNYSGIMQRAFLVGTAVNGVTPLMFQDVAAVATEQLNVQPFGTFTSASTGQSGERRVELGLRLEF
ncbi:MULTISPECIES: TonB-dependent receptor [Acidobacteriaceae]|uniref:TonB-dependent receptor n=1 Tax=Acidobacteriaceae TaxID=204434 RepID=UPI0020B10702|nr:MULTISPECIES: carboxypeptidase regulatory-like domain-containing protein [Acidobacteriaceae]MDW5265567.1 carboxypeptidase regulatory-like domain-containing protein [Edaphobacter sp.]